MSRVSIIIATYNCADVIISNLESLLAQDFCGVDFEIVIIDDASSDGTPAVVEAFCRNHDRIRFYPLKKNHGNGFCKNMGIDKAQGDYIVFMDDHLFFKETGVVCKLVSFLKKRPDILGVCGKYCSSNESDYNLCRDIRRFTIYEKNGRDNILTPKRFIPFSIVISAFKRSRLKTFRFPENFKQSASEDIKMQVHAHEMGNTFAYLANIDVSHDHNLGFFDLIKKGARELEGFRNLILEMCTNSYFRSIYLPAFISCPLFLWLSCALSLFVPQLSVLTLVFLLEEILLLAPIFKSRHRWRMKVITFLYCLTQELCKPLLLIKLVVTKPQKAWAILTLVGKWEWKKVGYLYEHRFKKSRSRKTTPAEQGCPVFRGRTL